MRKIAVLTGLVAVLGLTGLPEATGQGAGGPMVLMGIDAADCGPGGHGPITVYEDVVESVLDNVTKSGSGILVFGGDGAGDCITLFWDAIGAALGVSITYVEGAGNISSQAFSSFQVLVVGDSEGETSGGITQAENDALAGRAGDIASFVNGGGGLMGFTQAGLTNPYAYLGGVGAFTVDVGQSYDDITPTAAGSAVGITNALDVCCWHDTYTNFPAFLSVLAVDADSGEAAALGGEQVVVGGKCPGFKIKGNFILGTKAPDTLKGTKQVDTICGLAGNDTIRAGHGKDQVAGNKGHDVLKGMRQGDVIKGGPGDDLLVGGRGNDTLIGGKGFDTCKGGFGKDTFKGCEVIHDS